MGQTLGSSSGANGGRWRYVTESPRGQSQAAQGDMASRRGKSGSFLGVMETKAVARDQMNFDLSGLVHSPRLATTAQD